MAKITNCEFCENPLDKKIDLDEKKNKVGFKVYVGFHDFFLVCCKSCCDNQVS